MRCASWCVSARRSTALRTGAGSVQGRLDAMTVILNHPSVRSCASSVAADAAASVPCPISPVQLRADHLYVNISPQLFNACDPGIYEPLTALFEGLYAARSGLLRQFGDAGKG